MALMQVKDTRQPRQPHPTVRPLLVSGPSTPIQRCGRRGAFLEIHIMKSML